MLSIANICHCLKQINDLKRITKNVTMYIYDINVKYYHYLDPPTHTLTQNKNTHMHTNNKIIIIKELIKKTPTTRNGKCF